MASTVVLLIAFAVRVIWLDRQPLWWDEGLNVFFAHQSLTDLIAETRITHDANPPVYRLALGRWIDLVGSSAFTLRLFSVGAGMTTVALTLMLGRWLLTQKAALLGALLVALAPMQVYYGRETKSYALAAALALVSTYVWARKLGYLGGPEGSAGAIGWWCIYVIGTAAVLGTHYYLSLLVLWQGLWAAGRCVLTCIRRDRTASRTATRKLLHWMLAMVVVALLLTPWVLVVFGTTTEMVTEVSEGQSLSVGGYLLAVDRAFGAGPRERGAVPLVLGLGLAGSGVLGLLDITSSRRRVFLITWIAVPLAAAYVLQSSFSFFSPRFLLHLGPPCYLLAAAGILVVGRRLRAAGTAAIIVVIAGVWGVYLHDLYTEPPIVPEIGRMDEAEDPRPAIARLRQVSRPNDALAYVYIWQVGYVHAYYPQNELVFYRAHYSPATAEHELRDIFNLHSRLWRLSYRPRAKSPTNTSSAWLQAIKELDAYQAESESYGRHTLGLYVSPSFQTPGLKVNQGVLSFDNRIQLTYPTINAQLSPGDVLALPLTWQALTELDQDYKVFIHLALPNQPPLAQKDSRPCNGLAPTQAWTVGERVVDPQSLLLPETLPAGHYQVRVGLYRASNGARVPIDDAGGQDTVILGQVEVQR